MQTRRSLAFSSDSDDSSEGNYQPETPRTEIYLEELEEKTQEDKTKPEPTPLPATPPPSPPNPEDVKQYSNPQFNQDFSRFFDTSENSIQVIPKDHVDENNDADHEDNENEEFIAASTNKKKKRKKKKPTSAPSQMDP